MATKNRLKKKSRVGSEGIGALRSTTCIQDRSELTECVDCLNVLGVVWKYNSSFLSSPKALDTYRLLAMDQELSNNSY